MKILLIDDDAVTLKTLTLKISNEGHECYTAHNANEALEIMKTIKPDLIISDVMMPYMSGLEFLNLINFDMDKKIPVILMSSLKQKEVINLSVDLGAWDYLIKPISAKDLTDCLEKVQRLVESR